MCWSELKSCLISLSMIGAAAPLCIASHIMPRVQQAKGMSIFHFISWQGMLHGVRIQLRGLRCHALISTAINK